MLRVLVKKYNKIYEDKLLKIMLYIFMYIFCINMVNKGMSFNIL